jgi:phosphoribosyl-dephospho-CoA transferase
MKTEPAARASLRRHNLAYLDAEGWRVLLDADWDDAARACLRHWSAHDLPLVVARQRLADDAGAHMVALGLAAPETWGRRRLALQVAPARIARFGEFPLLGEVLDELPPAARPALRELDIALAGHGLRARAYGSAGWQRLSGLRHLHAGSDLDLWLGIATADAADAADQAVAALQRHAPAGLRLDGELVFADGGAVAWREWQAWRAGRCNALLVKRLHCARLEASPWLAPSAQQALAA